MTHNRDLAHYYAAAGYRVLPINPTSKRPLVPGGFHAATDAADQIAAWWRQWPLALPGIATSTFFVLDIDHPSDGSPEALASVLEAIGLEFVVRHAGLIGRTPSGGAHLYYSRTPGVAIGTRAGDLATGLDTRGHDGNGRPTGYIIAAGAIRPDGSGYRVVRGSIDEIEQAPRRLLALAHFNRRERGMIAGCAKLRTAINDAAPDVWRAVYDDHVREIELDRFRSAPKLTADTAGPLRSQALDDLRERADRLASTVEGRKGEVFRAAASIGKYLAAGILTASEITTCLLQAWALCGAAQKHGVRYGAEQIAAGLKISARDPLPPLAKRFRDPASATSRFVSRPLQLTTEVTRNAMDRPTT